MRVKLILKVFQYWIIGVVITSSPKISYAEIDPDWEEAASLAVMAVVRPYTSVKLSNDQISFDVLGEPGDYYSKESVTVTVASNQSEWSLHAMATDLTPEGAEGTEIPSERLAFSINNDGVYYPLGKSQGVYQGEAVQEPEELQLSFRLTTSWEDLPATYRGNITFYVLSTP